MVSAIFFLSCARWRCFRLGFFARDFAADDFAIERERLKDQIVALAVLVREHKADVEPVVILTFASDD